MLSGYSCFCQDAPMACRLGLAAGLRYGGRGGSRVSGTFAGSLATASGEDPTDGTALRARRFAPPPPTEAA